MNAWIGGVITTTIGALGAILTVVIQRRPTPGRVEAEAVDVLREVLAETRTAMDDLRAQVRAARDEAAQANRRADDAHNRAAYLETVLRSAGVQFDDPGTPSW